MKWEIEILSLETAELKTNEDEKFHHILCLVTCGCHYKKEYVTDYKKEQVNEKKYGEIMPMRSWHNATQWAIDNGCEMPTHLKILRK